VAKTILAAGLLLLFGSVLWWAVANRRDLKGSCIGWAWLIGPLCFLAVVIAIRISDKYRPGFTDGFQARYHGSLSFAYPGTLIYVYNSKFGPLIAPLGYLIAIEVINTGSRPTKIASYTFDVFVNGDWARLPNLPFLDPQAFFWVNNGDLKSCRRLDFKSNAFDLLARGRLLEPGDSVTGVMFFEWPREFRPEQPNVNRIRLDVEDSLGNHSLPELVLDEKRGLGENPLSGWFINVMPGEPVDLSSLRIVPHSDLIAGFRDGTIK
jgi:hypothetical protein